MNANPTLSHATSNRTARRVRPALFAVIDIMAGASMTMARWWQVRQDERLLLSQPDHLLRDVGIAREDIRTTVRGHAQR
jgi:uncharacterized protein YjiS (DUF1127 family)